jgi:tetratricopeptide (TPR) repeat protein
MTENALFPQYIHRPEEGLILDEVARVQGDSHSRVVLLYGPGGVGKTQMMRELAKSGGNSEKVVWVNPIDIDDPEYWALPRLESHIIDELDSDGEFFRKYREYIGQLLVHSGPQVDYERVISIFGRTEEVFPHDYREFVERTRKTVVIVLDTVETIRGTYLLLTLTQWMKKLPATLFVMVGRPADSQDEKGDSIRAELTDPHRGLPVTSIILGDFPEQAARNYLTASPTAKGVTGEELEKLVRLTRGHPLWLAFTIAYLWERGVPEEAERTPLATIEREIAYSGRMTRKGTSLHEDFKRRLMTPYREAGFWPEAVRRLAVVRQSISEQAWRRLMSDVALPDGVSDHHLAWEQLLSNPWIRLRANGHQVTLHDAVAEELAQRVIPVHYPDKVWLRDLWRRSAVIYGELIDTAEADLGLKAISVNERLWEFRDRQQAGEDRTTAEDSAFVGEVSKLNAQKSDLDQLRAAWLYYRLLSDHEAGCRSFLKLFEDARTSNEVMFLDLLANEMQRFLPIGGNVYAFDDVISVAIGEFRKWLEAPERSKLRLDIALTMADYLIRKERPNTAIELLTGISEPQADHERRYRLAIQRGNACMRIPGQMDNALRHFRLALAAAEAQTSDDRYKLIAKAHKELGFYYRNAGMWQEANGTYRSARDALTALMPSRDPYADREEMASIQTNWAYVKGLVGRYRDGQNLAESAITIRRRIGNRLGEGNSWSVCGEVYRYERRFHKAWEAYARAEEIFDLAKNWEWLGLIYQQQAICLFQAAQDRVVLLPGLDPITEARRLITQALDICHDQAKRHYPSALNRAGRIFWRDDVGAGLGYLAEGIEWARQLSDGWFYCANLIEYVELSYRAWQREDDDAYLGQIRTRSAEIEQAMDEYRFADLRGRWLLLQGHLAVHRWLEEGDDHELEQALNHYREGFGLIAQDYVGSSGASAIPNEFRKFRRLFERLPPDIQANWRAVLRVAWRQIGGEGEEGGSTLLLARLEELS